VNPNSCLTKYLLLSTFALTYVDNISLLYFYKFLLVVNIYNNHIDIGLAIGANTFYLLNSSLDLLVQNLTLY
jgi:hypothetical protein